MNICASNVVICAHHVAIVHVIIGDRVVLDSMVLAL